MTTFTVNGEVVDIDLPADTPLLWVLRDELKLKGTKYGCGIAQCGACTVHFNGTAFRACQLRLSMLEGAEITTIEALSDGNTVNPVQQAWIELQVAQCGYCQSGQIMQATDLLSRKPDPSDEDIDRAMSGNLCRCGTYPRIREAIRKAAQLMREADDGQT